jgi:drug/metabolite transporter (DMT)-like permease
LETALTAEQTRVATQTVLLTALAMLAFAANSLLCRMAIGHDLIDAASFTAIRVFAGAATLGLILTYRGRLLAARTNDWRPAAALFTYMVFFSFAYHSLTAGTGALILFGAVQLTMFTVALWSGERFAPIALGGLAMAIAGLIYLVSPGLEAPDLFGASLMAVAGIAWGVYSLLGRSARDPLEATAWAFLYALIPTLAVTGVAEITSGAVITTKGAALAVASGAVASGCGYVIWYAALRGLTAARAATVQLSVPAIAALGGVLFIGEDLTTRLVLASVATIGGIAIVLTQRAKR